LGEAIESVLAQTRPAAEIVVIDDGSTDRTADVARSYRGVRYVRQESRGTAAARNRGVRESTGDLLVLLDADDRLLPVALETGASRLADRPNCGLVFGACRLIAEDGSDLPGPGPPGVTEDAYLALLQGCPIRHPASAMWRRAVFEAGIHFDVSLPVCSDYDFYLRVARAWPLYGYGETVSEYRQHPAQKSVDHLRMLKHVTRILQAQRRLIAGNERYEEACGRGIENWRREYFDAWAMRVWVEAWSGNWSRAGRDVARLLAHDPRRLSRLVSRKAYRVLARDDP